MIKGVVYHVACTDPFKNLAFENHLFRNIDESTYVLLLWQNHPSVIVGRFQNPWLECNIEEMNRLGVEFVRRQSGGGAVYHDFGNLNFTFMAPMDKYDQKLHDEIISKALRSFGISVSVGKGNSYWSKERKFSGSAFKQTKKARFHHGTLLVKTDLRELESVLTPTRHGDYETRSIASIPSPVINLSEFGDMVTVENLANEIALVFKEQFEEFHTHFTNLKDTADVIQENENELRDWTWRFGETPKFRYEVKSDELTVLFNIHKGVIQSVECSEGFWTHPEMEEVFIKAFQGFKIETNWQNAKKLLEAELPEVFEDISFIFEDIEKNLISF